MNFGAQKALAQGVENSIIGRTERAITANVDDGPDDFDSLDEAPPRPQADRAPPPQIQSQPAPMRGRKARSCRLTIRATAGRASRAALFILTVPRGPDRQSPTPRRSSQGQPQPQQGQPAGDGVARPPAGVTAGVPDGQPLRRPRATAGILPEEDQPETGAPKELPPHLKKQEVVISRH